MVEPLKKVGEQKHFIDEIKRAGTPADLNASAPPTVLTSNSCAITFHTL
jgi:hypothetical protein